MAESASGRRRPWAAALCFVCCRGDGEPRGKLRLPEERKLRDVQAPADGSAEDDQAGVRRGEDGGAKVSLLRSFCCFLPPARTPRRKGTSSQVKQQERMTPRSPEPRNGDGSPPAEASPARRAEQRIVAPSTATEIVVAAATNTPDNGDAGGSSGEALSVAARAGGSTEAAYFQKEFGPAAGLCVVAAASTAGLLGGRLLAVVAFLCAWFFALWIRRRRRLAAGTGSKASEQR